MKKYILFFSLLTLMACSSDVTKKTETEAAKTTETVINKKPEKEVTLNVDVMELDFPEVLGLKKRADWGWVPIDREVNSRCEALPFRMIADKKTESRRWDALK